MNIKRIPLLVTKQVTETVIDNKATGAKAKAVRERRGWTLREAGEKAGCSFAYISDLENGHRGWGGKIGLRYLDLLGE